MTAGAVVVIVLFAWSSLATLATFKARLEARSWRKLALNYREIEERDQQRIAELVKELEYFACGLSRNGRRRGVLPPAGDES